MSTSPVVTATTRADRRFLLSGYGRWWSVLSRKSSIPDKFMFVPQVQSVRRSRFHLLECTRDPGKFGQVPFPVVLERAGHSVASVVTATNPLPISIGLTVTCRVGTCVHHPGYCQDWNLRKPVTLAGHCVTTTLESRGPLLGRRQNFHNNVPAGFAAATG